MHVQLHHEPGLLRRALVVPRLARLTPIVVAATTSGAGLRQRLLAPCIR